MNSISLLTFDIKSFVILLQSSWLFIDVPKIFIWCHRNCIKENTNTTGVFEDLNMCIFCGTSGLYLWFLGFFLRGFYLKDHSFSEKLCFVEDGRTVNKYHKKGLCCRQNLILTWGRTVFFFTNLYKFKSKKKPKKIQWKSSKLIS